MSFPSIDTSIRYVCIIESFNVLFVPLETMMDKLPLMLPAVGCHQAMLNLSLEYKNVLKVR